MHAMTRVKHFGHRKWFPFRDDVHIVHHATRMTKKEAAYVFRLSASVRALASCGECGAEIDAECRRKKDNKLTRNHSTRVDQARRVFRNIIEPKLDRLHQTLCAFVEGEIKAVFNAADGHEVDCMACVVTSTTALPTKD